MVQHAFQCRLCHNTPPALSVGWFGKTFDIHSEPLSIRDEIKNRPGRFSISAFWGPRAGIASSKWIANSAKWTEKNIGPDFNLIYLPHLDYDLQRYGPNDPNAKKHLREIDQLAGSLIDFLRKRGIECIVLSEYGITEVNKAIYPKSLIPPSRMVEYKRRIQPGTLDSGGSKAFAITDHQVAHIYLKDNDPEIQKKSTRMS